MRGLGDRIHTAHNKASLVNLGGFLLGALQWPRGQLIFHPCEHYVLCNSLVLERWSVSCFFSLSLSMCLSDERSRYIIICVVMWQAIIILLDLGMVKPIAYQFVVELQLTVGG